LNGLSDWFDLVVPLGESERRQPGFTERGVVEQHRIDVLLRDHALTVTR